MKIHPLVFILWIPLWILILAIGFRLNPVLHSILVTIFQLSTFGLIVIARDTIWKAFKNPEFWLAIFSLIFTFGILEFAIRSVNIPWMANLKYDDTYFQPDEWYYVQHHYNLYAHNPNWVGQSGNDLVNSYGFRGPEFERIPSDETFRIVTLGGSTTAGLSALLWSEAYPAQLQQVLNEEYGLEHVEVINAGHAAYTSWESLINFEFRVIDLDPDMIIFYQNTNDVHPRIINPETYRSDNSGYRYIANFDEASFTNNRLLQIPSLLLRLILTSTGLAEAPSSTLTNYFEEICAGYRATEECLGVTPQEALASNPPIYYQRNIENIVALAQAHDIEVVLMTWAYNDDISYDEPTYDYAVLDYYQDAFDEHNEVMRQVAEETGVYLFDFAPLMPNNLEYWLDGRHMSAEGNRIRAELIAEFLTGQNLIP